VWTVKGGSDRAINPIELNRIDSFVALNRIEPFSFFAESPITSLNTEEWVVSMTGKCRWLKVRVLGNYVILLLILFFKYCYCHCYYMRTIILWLSSSCDLKLYVAVISSSMLQLHLGTGV